MPKLRIFLFISLLVLIVAAPLRFEARAASFELSPGLRFDGFPVIIASNPPLRFLRVEHRAPPRYRVPWRSDRAVFRITHENHAWVFFHASCEIRADGRVMQARYSNPPERIVGFDLIGRVAPAEVRRMAFLLRDAAHHDLTEPRQVMADFGAITLVGYARGQAVTLQVRGDVHRDNPSRAARRIASWAASVFPEDCPTPPDLN